MSHPVVLFLTTKDNKELEFLKEDILLATNQEYDGSDTPCPAFHDCESEWGEAGQQPQWGQSSLEHRGTFVLPA